jgi:sulfur relay (sulfurtransferase) DsrF/TusC family protein
MPDFLDGLYLSYEAVTISGKRDLFGGIAIIYITFLSFVTIIMFQVAHGITNYLILVQTAALLFLNNFHEEIYKLIYRLFPIFVEKTREINKKKCEALAKAARLKFKKEMDVVLIEDDLKCLCANQDQINIRMNDIQDTYEDYVEDKLQIELNSFETKIAKLQTNVDEINSRKRKLDEEFLKQVLGTNLRIEKLECIVKSILTELNYDSNSELREMLQMMGREQIEGDIDERDKYGLIRHMCVNNVKLQKLEHIITLLLKEQNENSKHKHVRSIKNRMKPP